MIRRYETFARPSPDQIATWIVCSPSRSADGSELQQFVSRGGRPSIHDGVETTNQCRLSRQAVQINTRSRRLPRIRLYDLRHSAATIALAAGVSSKVVSEQLGHASTAFTLDTYAHVLPPHAGRGCRKGRSNACWKSVVMDI